MLWRMVHTITTLSHCPMPVLTYQHFPGDITQCTSRVSWAYKQSILSAASMVSSDMCKRSMRTPDG